jgi:NTP pyrophosphatase (non-canonical NTP hydrolase)
MSDIKTITEALINFRNERDWEQFHNPKDLVLAINVEAGELLELFLWKNAEDANKEKIKEELADVFAYAFLLADKYQFDIKNIQLHPWAYLHKLINCLFYIFDHTRKLQIISKDELGRFSQSNYNITHRWKKN